MSTMTLEQAVRLAFHLGQIYWQQADSESSSQNKKADETMAEFNELLNDITSREAKGEPYGYLYWTRNGDGTRSEEFARKLPSRYCADWGFTALYTHPAPQQTAQPDQPKPEQAKCGTCNGRGDIRPDLL